MKKLPTGQQFSNFKDELQLVKKNGKALQLLLKVLLSIIEDVPNSKKSEDAIIIVLTLLNRLQTRQSEIFIAGKYSNHVLEEMQLRLREEFLPKEHTEMLQDSIKLVQARNKDVFISPKRGWKKSSSNKNHNNQNVGRRKPRDRLTQETVESLNSMASGPTKSTGKHD